jgi:tRNA-splicing ligase RtcB
MIDIFGPLESEETLQQMKACLEPESALKGVLMADHHLGYSMPVGGVVAYKDHVSPSGVGFDIACGNKAVRLNVSAKDVQDNIKFIMDDIFANISFGVGQKNSTKVEHEIFDDPRWAIAEPILKESGRMSKDAAREQLGTVGSGNHYVDIFVDEQERVWIGVHFGSRGLGHKLATYFVKAGGGVDTINAAPTLFHDKSDLGEQYIQCMQLAGDYAYAGRDWVCSKVASLLGAEILEEVHNHHNFAWQELHYINGENQLVWVVRKGATPAFTGQKGFVGGSMGDNSVILEGLGSQESRDCLFSTVHGAGRVMSRTQAAGKKRWKRVVEGEPKRLVQTKEGCVSKEMMIDWVNNFGVELRGAGTDESPHCYKRLHEVLAYHSRTIKILHTLKPIGVAMAGADEYDPYKD